MTCTPDPRWLLPFALVLAAPATASADAVRQALAQSVIAWRSGDATAARAAAQRAADAEPRAGLAWAMVARMAIAQGDGVAGEAALDRAGKAGFPDERMIHLRAHARLLQGDAAGALELASSPAVPPRYRGYAARMVGRAAYGTGDHARAAEAIARATQLAPGDSAVWSDLAQLRRFDGDLAGAGEAVDRALRIDGTNREALVLKAALFREQYGLTASLPWLEVAIDQDAYDGPALIAYAATLGELGRYREMLAAARRGAAVRGSTADALYLQAVLAARARNHDLARSLIQRTNGALDDMPGMLLLAGGLDLASGAYGQATERLGRLVEQQPDNRAARRLLGGAFLGAGDAVAAIDTLQPIVRAGDADSYALTIAARAHEMRGERDVAGELLDRAARPVLRQGAGDPRELVGAANARFDESNALALVAALDRVGQRIEAQRVLALYLQQNPRSIAARRIAADWQIAARDWRAAAATLEGVRRRVGNRDVALLAQLGWALAGAGQRERALLVAQAAYEIAPASPIAADTLGVLLSRDPTRRADGIALLTKAARIAPGNRAIAAHLAAARAAR